MDLNTWGREFWSELDAEMDPEVKALALEAGIAEISGYKLNQEALSLPAVQMVQNWCAVADLQLTDAALLLVSGLADRVGFLVAWVWALKYRSEGTTYKLGIDWVLGTFGESYRCPSESRMIWLCKALKEG